MRGKVEHLELSTRKTVEGSGGTRCIRRLSSLAHRRIVVWLQAKAHRTLDETSSWALAERLVGTACSTVARLGVSTYAQSHAPCFFHRDRLGFTEPSRRGLARLLRGRPPPSALSPSRRLARHPACLGFARARI